MSPEAGRCNLGAKLVFAGSALGVLAGIVQVAIGSDIPDWTGHKASPGALGIATIVLSAVAGGAASVLNNPAARPARRLAATGVVFVIGLICFSTVGWLWLVPGPLLLAGAALGVETRAGSAAIVRHNWLRILLAALGFCELLMAAGASRAVMAIGTIGGLSLIGAVGVSRSRLTAAGLIALGTIPFAVVAWTAVVPLLVLVVAAGLAVAILRTPTVPALDHTR